MTQGNKPESSIACCPEKVSAENAAFVNGTFGHGFEMDDVYAAALAHPGPAVVPAALAIAERDGCSGKDLLLAVVAGYEVMGRCGYALSPRSCTEVFTQLRRQVRWDRSRRPES